MTMNNKSKLIAYCGGSHGLGLASAILAGNSHCLDSDDSVEVVQESLKYEMQPMPSDFDEPPPTPSAYRKPRSIYTPHMGAKELRKHAQNK